MRKQLVICWILLMTILSCNQNNVDVKDNFRKFKSEFVYFSSIKNKIFTNNVGCHAYSAIFTIREVLWQDCNVYSVDSGEYFKSDFLTKVEEDRLKTFMSKANIYAINYVPDSVLFYFRDGASQKIFFTEKTVANTENIEKIYSKFYCTEDVR